MNAKPVVFPVTLSATFEFDTSDELIDVVQRHEGFIYSRWDNPTVVETENALAKMEGYQHALGFASGMAAISTSVLAFVRPGDRVVAMQEVYGGTYELMNDILPAFGVETVLINCWDTQRILAEIDKGLKVLYLETPTNPLLRVVEAAPLVEAAHKQGAVAMLDGTFASPVNQHPKDWAVDLVIHSATKYLGGHHDITGGFVCCDAADYDRVWQLRKVLGGVMDPMTAFLTARGLKTLELRIVRQNESAMKVARYLERHPKIQTVNYPGLPGHPDHDIAARQMTGFGGMLSFELAGDFEQTKRFMDQLQTIKLATSLGGVTSLATQPITNTHIALSPENRAKAGVGESLVRLSVGVEPVEELIRDLEGALGAKGHWK